MIEHLLRPDELLAKLKKHLDKTGIIFIEIPNCENNTVLKDSVLTQPHTFHFSKKAITELAEKNEYKVERCDYFRPANLVEGGLNRVMRKRAISVANRYYRYYPKIISTNTKGIDIRLILRNNLHHNI